MSRLGSGSDAIVIKPTNNVYTVLVAVAVVIEIIGLIALWMQSKALFQLPPFAG